MFKKLFVIFAIVIGVVVLAGCAAKGPEKISVVNTEFKFEPDTWTVSAGKEVEMTLINQGKVEHEWVIIKLGEEVTLPFNDDDEAKVYWEIEAPPGETKVGTFTAPSDPGTYTIVCGTPGHLEAGMTGTLIVQ